MDVNTPKARNLPLGLFYMSLMTVTLTISGFCGQVAQKEVNSYQLAFVMNVICLLFMIPTVVIRRGWGGFLTRHVGIHLIRDLAGGIGFLAYVMVLPHLPLVDAMLLSNTAPLWVPFVVWAWLRHRVPSRLYWGTVLGFVGIILVLQPGGGGFNWWMVVGLIAGFCLGITFVAIRVLNKTEGPYVILFYYFAVASLVTMPFAIGSWQAASLTTWCWMGAVGLSMLATQVFLVLAGQRGPATVLSPLLYLSIIWGVLVDWSAYGEVPNLISWVGIALVATGGILSLVLGGRVQKIADASVYPKHRPER